MRLKKPKEGWRPVESAAVMAVRYDAITRELDVRFEDGREYRYANVPRSKFRALHVANSIGAFINREVKPFHPCQELSSETRGFKHNNLSA
jgi:hypothetical protein